MIYEWFKKEIFQKPVMDRIFDTVEPEYTDVLLRDTFYPIQTFDSDKAIAYIAERSWGMTRPTELGALPSFLSLPGGWFKEYYVEYWGEAHRFTNVDLQQIKNPTKPYNPDGSVNLWGQTMMAKAMQMQKDRMRRLQEYMAARNVCADGFTINDNGIYRTYSTGMPNHYIVDLSGCSASTPKDGGGSNDISVVDGWTCAEDWANVAASDPINDINMMKRYAAQIGLSITGMYMRTKVADYISKSETVRSWVEKNPNMSADMATVGYIVKEAMKLDDIDVITYNASYSERAMVTADVSSGDSTITVDNDKHFADGGVILIRAMDNNITSATASATGAEEMNVVSGTPSSNVITLTNAASRAYPRGSAVIIHKPYLDDNVVIFKTNLQKRSATAILPSNPYPGELDPRIHTWSHEYIEPPNYRIEVGTFGKMGPIDFDPGGYFRMKVAA